MSIAEFSIKRPVTTIMFFVSLFAIGLIAAVRLPLEAFPEVSPPFIFVSLPYAGSTPEEVERTVLRPAEGQGGDIQRWTYQPHLLRQICFTSITGQFSCAAGVSEDLTEASSGEAPAPPELGPEAPPIDSSAEAARLTLATRLSARAPGLFDEDRRLKINPMFKAAGVTVRSATGPLAAPATKR